jgi:Ni/Co efflux regulator RcnB
MKRFFTATAATGLALSLLTAPLAMAQQAPQDHSDQKAPTAHTAPVEHAPMQPNAMSHAQAKPAETRPAEAAQNRPITTGHAQAPEQHAAIAPRPPVQQHVAQQSSHEWRHGDRYTGDRRVVSDWNRYHANPPPPGYEWVQDGNELVLISITSGIIASVLANAVYQ